MKKTKITITLIIIFIIIMFMSRACGPPKASIIAKVVDEETGLVIEDADVKLGFVYTDNIAHGWGAQGISDSKEGKSDKSGFFSGSGETRQDTMAKAIKKGYYISGQSIKDMVNYNKVLNRWEPWPCEVTIKLKKIKAPIPMFVKFNGDPLEEEMSIPEKNTEIGYDLEIGDWVSPYGKGEISDFILKMKEGEYGLNKVKLDTFDLSFSNEYDGIQEFSPLKDNQSTFIFPYLAPVQKYLKKHQFFREWIKTERYGYQFKGNNMGDKRFIFRVRTKVDSQGNILSAQYGILSDVGFSIYKDKFKTFAFTYKLNSDNQSRSLEFSGENLFKDRDEKGRLKD